LVLQHTWASCALVPLFHVGNIMVKAFFLLVTDGTKHFRQEVQSVNLRNLFVGSCYILYFYKSSENQHYLTIVFCLMISPEGFSNSFEWLPRNFSHLIHLIIKFLVFYQLHIWGPTKIPFSILTSLTLGKIILGTEITHHFDPPPWRNFLSTLVWCVKRWANLFRINQWLFFPGIHESFFGHCLYVMIFPICCLVHAKSLCLLYPSCKPSKRAANFRSSPICREYFS
jgi:hypothetical protein